MHESLPIKMGAFDTFRTGLFCLSLGFELCAWTTLRPKTESKRRKKKSPDDRCDTHVYILPYDRACRFAQMVPCEEGMAEILS